MKKQRKQRDGGCASESRGTVVVLPSLCIERQKGKQGDGGCASCHIYHKINNNHGILLYDHFERNIEMDIVKGQEILEKYNTEQFHLQHAAVVSGVMRYFAKEYDPEREEYWALVGLLHDIDFGMYPEEHCVKGEELLKAEGFEEDFFRSALSHGWGMTGSRFEPEHIMEKILYACDELTGLIWATTLMRPSKSTKDLEVSSVKKKFKDKKFAAGCSRDVVQKGAEMLGWDLDELFERTIVAMRTLEED